MSDTPKPEVPRSDIKKGFGTWFGLAATVLLALSGVLQNFITENPELSAQNSQLFAALATAVAVAVILGRMLQSAALLFATHRDAPSPAQLDDFSGLDDIEPPTEAELAQVEVLQDNPPSDKPVV